MNKIAVNIKLFLFLLLISGSLFARDTIFPRLATERYEDDYDDLGLTTIKDILYHYDPLEPALLDSASIYESTTQGDITYSIIFDSSICLEGNTTTIVREYWDSDWGKFVRITRKHDQLGRFTYYRLDTRLFDGENYIIDRELFRRFNSVGYADSIFYVQCYGSNQTFNNRVMRYFENNRLTQTVWQSGYGQLNPYRIISYSYPESPLTLSNFIRFDILEPTSLSPTTEYVYNPKEIPSSIDYVTWNGSQWIPQDNPQYFQSTTADLVVSLRSDGIIYEGGSYYDASLVSPSGLITQYRSISSGQMYSTHQTSSFTWYSPSSSDDNACQQVEQRIHAYPNPFQQNLYISGKDLNLSYEVFVYNLRGQLVNMWRSDELGKSIWDGSDYKGLQCTNGIYLLRFEFGNNTSENRRVVLLHE